jgi:hypothetical protein
MIWVAASPGGLPQPSVSGRYVRFSGSARCATAPSSRWGCYPHQHLDHLSEEPPPRGARASHGNDGHNVDVERRSLGISHPH